jgi:tryptophan synthase alpha chain
MGRIAERFAVLRERGEVALIPFIMAGDPDLGVTKELLRAAAASGADLIEIGVPFSDPTADGPVLQRSAYRALRRGASLPRILELVSDLRDELDVPLILFGYYNPIFHYGPEVFSRDARQAGVDGLLVVDLPPEEAEELWRPAHGAGLDLIFLLAPTSDAARVQAVMRRASGFVYYVSMTGVTGSRAITPMDVRPAVDWVRQQCPLPIGVGFGISSRAAAAAVAEFADAVIVGTSIMQLVESNNGHVDLAATVGSFIGELKAATRLHRGGAAQ